MNRTTDRVFIDTNMLLFAVQYEKEDVFTWFNALYENIWIHVDVLEELLTGKNRVLQEIHQGNWHLYDPNTLPKNEKTIYNAEISQIKDAFRHMNERREYSGRRNKKTANTGEISTLAVCLLEDAHLICSNDFDVREVVEAEQYTYVDENDVEHLIIQDTAEDFCYYCSLDASIKKSKVRHFFKSIFDDKKRRDVNLKRLDARLSTITNSSL